MILSLSRCFWLHPIVYFLDLQMLVTTLHSFLQYFLVFSKDLLFCLLLSSFTENCTQWMIIKSSLFNSAWIKTQIFTSQMFIFFKVVVDNANILATFMSKSYCASFCINFNLISYCHFNNSETKIFLNLRWSLAGNVVLIIKN